MSRMLRYVTFGLLAAALLVALTASADSPRRWWHPQPQPQFRVSLEDHAGRSLRTFQHGGTTFVLGEPGQAYVIRVQNLTNQRVEAVVSVDGRDAVSGEVADFVQHRGYLLPPFGSVRIDGFRQSLEQVATFRFTDPSDSYSSRMGTPENVGVIGVAFFRERARQVVVQPPRRWRDVPRAAPAPRAAHKRSAGRSAAPRDDAAESDSRGNLGTEYGERRFSPVSTVPLRSRHAVEPDARDDAALRRRRGARGARHRGVPAAPPPRGRARAAGVSRQRRPALRTAPALIRVGPAYPHTVPAGIVL